MIEGVDRFRLEAPRSAIVIDLPVSVPPDTIGRFRKQRLRAEHVCVCALWQDVQRLFRQGGSRRIGSVDHVPSRGPPFNFSSCKHPFYESVILNGRYATSGCFGEPSTTTR